MNPSSGQVTGVSAGTAVITVTASQASTGATAQAKVTVTVTGGTGPTTPRLSSVAIGGGTSVAAGGTLNLTATAYDTNNAQISSGVTFSWSSGNTAVATVNPSSGQVTGVSAGTAVITVTGTQASTGATAQAKVMVNVTEGDGTELDGDRRSRLDSINEKLARDDMALSFVDADPARVEDAAFQRAFRDIWNVNPRLLTNLRNASITFATRTGYVSARGRAVRPGVHVALSGRGRGDLLPMRYLWNYGWKDLSRLLGREVSSVPDAAELFRALTVEFQVIGGAGYPLIGDGGVGARQAETAGALRITQTGAGITVELTAYLANVQGPALSGRYAPLLISDLLIVPDGAADGVVGGTMWMMEKELATSSGTDKESGGGGGGCDAGLGALALAIAAVVLKGKDRK